MYYSLSSEAGVVAVVVIRCYLFYHNLSFDLFTISLFLCLYRQTVRHSVHHIICSELYQLYCLFRFFFKNVYYLQNPVNGLSL